MFRLAALVLCCQVLSQPVVPDGAPECCPCPSGESARADWAARAADDCPCRARDADSAGAPSLFFPTAIRPEGPNPKSTDQKEDPKNLLEPEVVLATSVLDTLREATEEGYREALEREAARNAESDAVPEESATNLIIVVNPKEAEDKEDFISEASHVQETRCVHPLETTSFDGMRSAQPVSLFPDTFKLLKHPELFKLPKHTEHLHRTTPQLFDNDLGASNVEERVPGVNNFKPQLFFDKFRNTKLSKNPLNIQNNNLRYKQQGLILEQSNDSDSTEAKSLEPKLKLRANINDDLSPASSNVKNLFHSSEDKNKLLENKLQTNLRNLLKLRDVELVPKHTLKKSWPKTKHDISKFAIPSLLKLNKNKNSNDSEKPSSNTAFRSNNDDLLQTEIDDDNNDNIETTPMEIGTSFKKEEPSHKLKENICDNDIVEDKETDFDTFSSASQIQSSIIRPENKVNPETNQQSTSANSNSDINSQAEFKENLDLSQEANCDLSDSKNVEVATDEENSENGEIPTNNLLKDNVESNSQDLETDNTNNFPTVAFFETKDNEHDSNDNEREKSIDNETNLTVNPSILFDDIPVSAQGKQNANEMSMSDLQNMSDKLLDSNFNEGNIFPDLQDTDDLQGMIDKSNFIPQNINLKSDSEPDTITDSTIVDIKESERSFPVKMVKESECFTIRENPITNLKEGIDVKSAIPNTEPKEMETGASDTVIKTLPSSSDPSNSNTKTKFPTLSDILKPANDPNLAKNPLESVFNINRNTPTLEDLKDRLRNMFTNTNEENTKQFATSEEDFINDTPLDPMAPEASSRNSQKELPLIKQLENMNNDLIYNKLKEKLRTLDLNSYRNNLPSHSPLDIKRLRLEPKLRENIQMDKSSNFRSGKTALRKPKISKTATETYNTFKDLPKFEELRDMLFSNTKKLVNIPDHTNLNPLSEQLRSHDIEEVTKNIRLNAEKTLKGLKRKMKSSLKTPNIHDSFRDSIAKPQNLFDDMNDKLKGIQYDLHDRLATIRENILDSSKINNVNDQTEARNRIALTNQRKSKTSKRPLSERFQTAASSVKVQELDPFSHNKEPRLHNHPDWNKSRKAQTTFENAPDPAKFEMPKMASLPNLQKISPYFRHDSFPKESAKDRTPMMYLDKDETRSEEIKDSLFKKNTKPNNPRRKSKVTISFGTTTARSIVLPPSSVRDSNSDSTLRTNDGNYKENTRLIPKITSSFKKTLPWPKLSENNLNKARDIERIRKLNENLLSNVKTEQLDMLRSPTENVGVALEEPLKENVSYKCKMVCTKER